MCWIAITKLLIKQNNEHEDAEKASDFLAMHVYKNKTPGKKILNAGRPLIKSVYTNEQTVMLYIRNIDKDEFTNGQLCLALD